GRALAGALPASGPTPTGARRRERALPLGERPTSRHEHPAAAAPPPAPAAPCVRHPPAGGRSRSAHDSGAARPQLVVDDADLFARRRPPPAPCLRPVAPSVVASPRGLTRVQRLPRARRLGAAVGC